MLTRTITVEDLNKLVKDDYEVIARCKDPNYVEIRFKTCQHEKQLTIAGIRKGKIPICYECNNKRFYDEGMLVGLELLPDSRIATNSDYRRYKHIVCGGVLEITPNSIRKHSPTQFYCKHCAKIELQPFADEFNFEIIEKDRPSYWKVMCKDCQNVISVQTSNIKYNSICCHNCNPNSYVLPSSVYILDIKDQNKNWIKIGHSARLQKRVKEYGLDKQAKITTLYELDFATRQEALKFENYLHKNLVSFALSKEEISAYHTESGFTECYNTGVLSVLNQEYLTRALVKGKFNPLVNNKAQSLI